MNWQKTIYWLATIIMLSIFLMSATMYVTKLQMVKGFYTQLGFPTWMVLPSAILKYIAIVIVAFDVNKILKEYAYAGFLIDASFAFAAHQMINDGQSALALIAIIATIISRVFYKFRNSTYF